VSGNRTSAAYGHELERVRSPSEIREDTVFEGMSWAEVAMAWRRDAGFRDEYASALAAEPSAAFAWETIPVTAATRDRAFEHAVIDSPALTQVTADPRPFASQLRGAVADICIFSNLGGDATLIVPTPAAAEEHYAHLAAFLRGAPRDQIHRLWTAVGEAVEEHWRESERPLWVSTAGLGVHWLHVRLDSRPKYYRHAAYRAAP
jgi:hypothetical protein